MAASQTGKAGLEAPLTQLPLPLARIEAVAAADAIRALVGL